MQSKSDAQLLRDYAERGLEAAFAEIVHRHTNLVYSAALRLVNSPDSAPEIAQNVFVGLARGAQTLSAQLAAEASLAGWLCRSTRNQALKLARDDSRRHSRERQAMELLDPISETAPDWARLRPVLDEAMAELTESDYDALVLRFFNNQDLKEVGRALGVSDDTAQKRVARALDKLRENLTRRGVATTGAALSLAISANAVSVAPAGLAATFATAAALAGTTLATTAAATAVKAIAMTTLQKTVITAALAAAVGTGIYEARRATKLQSEVQLLQQQQAALTGQIQQLASERDDAARQRSVIDDNSKRSNVDTSELLRLRGEVGLLRRQIAATRSTQETPTNQIQFTLPYSRREAWSDKGTDDPLNTILTMFWAIGQSDETKLGQIVSRSTGSQSLDQLTLPKRDWSNIAGIQIVNVSTAQLMMEGRLQDSANIDVIVEKALLLLDRTEKDFNVRRWMLTKANDQWLITGAR